MDNYEDWKEEYLRKEKVELKKYLNEVDFELIKESGIEVLDKIYTENEFEVLYNSILKLSQTSNKYTVLLEKLDKISEEYNF